MTSSLNRGSKQYFAEQWTLCKSVRQMSIRMCTCGWFCVWLMIRKNHLLLVSNWRKLFVVWQNFQLLYCTQDKNLWIHSLQKKRGNFKWIFFEIPFWLIISTFCIVHRLKHNTGGLWYLFKKLHRLPQRLNQCFWKKNRMDRSQMEHAEYNFFFSKKRWF